MYGGDEVKTLEKLRIYAASAAFIALTAVKLLSPAYAQELRQEVLGVINRDDDYISAVEALGDKLNFSGKKSGAAYASELYEPVTISELRAKSVSILPSPTPTPESMPTPTPTPAPTPVPTLSPTEKKVQAFMATQKEYSERAVPANVTYDTPTLPFKYESPVKGCTSSGFGYRLHPILNEIKYHYGTDFAAQSGDAVYAFADGKVLTADECDTYGKYIVISHADGYKTLYAHCSKLYVSAGSKVKEGQKIALVGQTGQATGPHLHFELMSGKTYLNPEFYL